MQTSERVTSAWLRTSYINVIKINEILYRYISYANRNFSGVFPTFAEKVREVAIVSMLYWSLYWILFYLIKESVHCQSSCILPLSVQ